MRKYITIGITAFIAFMVFQTCSNTAGRASLGISSSGDWISTGHIVPITPDSPTTSVEINKYQKNIKGYYGKEVRNIRFVLLPSGHIYVNFDIKVDRYERPIIRRF